MFRKGHGWLTGGHSAPENKGWKVERVGEERVENKRWGTKEWRTNGNDRTMRAPALERRSQPPRGRGQCETAWTAAVERGAASSLRAHVRARTRALGDQLLGCKDAVKLVEHRQDALLALDRRDAEPAHHADRVGARRAIVGGERVALEQDAADVDLEEEKKGGEARAPQRGWSRRGRLRPFPPRRPPHPPTVPSTLAHVFGRPQAPDCAGWSETLDTSQKWR